MEKIRIEMDKMSELLPKGYLLDSVINIYEHGLPQGYRTETCIDDIFRLDKGRVVTVTGIPNHGKSEFVDFLTVTYNKLYGLKTLFFSPENQPLELHMAKLVSKFTNKRLKESTKEEVAQAANYVTDNFWFYNYQKVNKLSHILNIASKAKVENGIDILVIDAYNKIESEKATEQIETEFISKVMDTLCRFAIKENILVILVAHPRKMSREVDNTFSMPSAYDINGSANFFNKSDFVFTVHRDFKKDETIIKCDKVKFSNYGKIGECRMKYDVASGNYYDIPEDDGRFHDEDDVDAIYEPIHFDIPQVQEASPLDVEVSLYTGASDNKGSTAKLSDFIFTDKYKPIAQAIRSGKTTEERHELKDKYKNSLPCATICGRFSQRGGKYLEEYSGFIGIDIDYKDNVDIIDKVPEILKGLDYVLYAGKSISGDGYFAVIKLNNPKCLKQHFLALEQDFKALGITIDKSCKDATRLRFASYNENPIYNPQASTYYKLIEERKDKKMTERPKDTTAGFKIAYTSYPSRKGRSSETDEQIVERHIKYLKDNNLQIADDYQSWFSIGMSLSSAFGEAGRQYFHSISSLSSKYDYTECNEQYDRALAYGAENSYTLGTLIHLFQEAEGYRRNIS